MLTMAPSGKMKIMVPELLAEREWKPFDLVRKAGIAQGTAYRLANGEAEAITMDVLDRLCDVFGVEVGDIIVRVIEEEE